MITAKQKALLIMILSVIGVLCVYSMRYPLENSRAAIQHQLVDWENKLADRPLSDHSILELINVIHLENSTTYVAFYRAGQDLRLVVLKEGLNKKLRTVHVGTKHHTFDYTGIETNKGPYGIISGRNTDEEIDSVQVKLQNFHYEYRMKVPETPCVIHAMKLPREVNQKTYADLYFFNKKDQKILLKSL